MVIDHDNYKWSFGQQLCAKMTNFCTFCLPFFPFSLSLSNLIFAIVVHMDDTRSAIPSSTTDTFMFELLVLAYYKHKFSNQEVQLYFHILFYFLKRIFIFHIWPCSAQRSIKCRIMQVFSFGGIPIFVNSLSFANFMNQG